MKFLVIYGKKITIELGIKKKKIVKQELVSNYCEKNEYNWYGIVYLFI